MDDKRLLKNEGWTEQATKTKSGMDGRHQGLVPVRYHTGQRILSTEEADYHLSREYWTDKWMGYTR